MGKASKSKWRSERLKERGFDKPLFINANVLKGPGGGSPKIDPHQFIETVKQYKDNFKMLVLSLGWTTFSYPSDKQIGYSQQMINDMLQLVDGYQGDITFVLRGAFVPKSVDGLNLLLSKPNHSLTIWDDSSNVYNNNFDLASYTDTQRTFYDLNPSQYDDLRFAATLFFNSLFWRFIRALTSVF